jgi:DNA modification methylase
MDSNEVRVFAPEYSRDEFGAVNFPAKDTDLRNMLFTYTDSSEHIVKSNMHMVKALIEFVSKPGEIVLDPFAGSGTILVAATMGRRVICIEIEEHFQKMIESNIKSLGVTIPDIEEVTSLIPGDCAKVLPVPNIAHHFIFSPPYANVLRKKAVDQFAIDGGYGSATLYSSSPDNIANLSDFLYHQKMEQVYKKIFASVIPGGTMTIIIKDRMEAGKRIKLGARARRDCLRIGFEPVAWNRWRALGGMFSAYNRSIGLQTVDEEDLITLRRP